MTSLSIRQFEPPDADGVWRVHEASLRASPIQFVPDAAADDDLRSIESEYLDAGGEFLVGTVEDRVVATGGYKPESETTAGTTVVIRRMRVHPDYQGRGFGRAVLAALESRAVEAGFRNATLETHEDLSAARSLYESAGYRETGRRQHPSGAVELVAYEKRLANP